MRHPFDGILQPTPPSASEPTRRSMLGRLLAGAAGLAGLLLGARAHAGPATTQAVGEEGGRPPVTTQALGEEGATTRRLREEGVTTQALGEEGARPPITTFALGEEGGPITTQALGEEGATTQALGEEGGVR